MSWQAYVDNLIASQSVDKAALFDSTGASVWAASPGFTVTPAELKIVVDSFNDKGDATGVKKIQSDGFHIASERFVTLRTDDRSLYGKKGREGVVIVKTKQAMLVTHYPETVQPGNAANTVEKMADYLISTGY